MALVGQLRALSQRGCSALPILCAITTHQQLARILLSYIVCSSASVRDSPLPRTCMTVGEQLADPVLLG